MKFIKAFVLCFVIFMLSSANIFAADKQQRINYLQQQKYQEVKEEPMFKTLVGISYMPSAKWDSGQAIKESDYSKGLYYTFDANSFTTYEGSLWHRSGFNLGVSANVDDTFIGKADKIMGLVGFKNISLRVSSGKLTGDAQWKGPNASGMPVDAKIDSKYQSYDLLYAFNPQDYTGAYVGISYTKYEIPMELQTLTKNNGISTKSGNPAYDPDSKFESFGILFGIDLFNERMATGKEGFDIWLYTQDALLLGTVKVSGEGMRRVQAENPTYSIIDKSSYFAMGVQYDITLGVLWTGKIGNRMSLGVGAGYSFSGQAFGVFGSGLEDYTNEMTISSYPYIFHHGPVIKAAISF